MLLLALLALHGIVNVVWLATDPDPPVNHHSSEQTALRHYLVLKGYPPVETHAHRSAYAVESPAGPGRQRGSFQPLFEPFRLGTDPGWVPLSLFHLVSVLLACLFGLSYTSLTSAGTVFFGITVTAVFFIGRRVRGPWTGLLAAVIVASYPFVFGCPRQYFIYQTTASMAALSVALLLHSDGLRRPWMAGLAALAVSLGMRAGESGTDATLLLLSLAGPIGVAFWLALRSALAPQPDVHGRARWGAVVFAAVLLPTMGLQWYIGQYVVHTLLPDLQAGGSTEYALAMSPPRGTLGFYTLHLREVAWVQIRSIPLLIVALGGIVWLASRWKQSLSWTLLLWVAVPAVVLSVIPQKNPWYLSSILPAVAVASALGIAALRGRARVAVAVVVVGACALQFVWLTALWGRPTSSWRTQHRRDMNLAQYSYVPLRHREPSSRTALAVEAIGAKLDQLDPERTGQLSVALVVPGDIMASCRIEMMLKTARPQMLTCTLLEPRALLGRDDFDLIAYVGDAIAAPPASDSVLFAALERSIAQRLQHGCPGALRLDDSEIRALSRQLDGWLQTTADGPYHSTFEGPIGMLLRNP